MIFPATTFRVAILGVAALFCLWIVGCDGSVEGARIELRASSGGVDEFTVTLPLVDRDLSSLPTSFWKQVFYVTVDGNSLTAKPSLAGKYELKEGGQLVFTPRFPLNTRIDYLATFDVGTFSKSDEEAVTRVFVGTIPNMTPVARVSAIYPNASSIPENNLKFYIHFSEPMSRGSSYENLSLVDESGGVIDLPFLELDEELWSRDGTRLTVFIDPGRIKQGLTPHEEVGPVFEKDRSYTLKVGSGFQDSQGRELVEDYEKQYAVTEFDSRSPNVNVWSITSPSVGTRTALEVDLKDHLDHALLHRLIWVNDQSGTPLEGRIETVSEDRIWYFVPDESWKAGAYNLSVVTELSDLAGNNLKVAFEVDITKSEEVGEVATRIEVPFEVAR